MSHPIKFLRYSFTLGMGMVMSVALAAPVEVRLTNGEWPPYLSEHLPGGGTVSRIVTESFAREGVQVKFGFFPWRRSLALARSKEWDGSVVWAKNAAREKDFFMSDPVIGAEFVLFYLKDRPVLWNTVADLTQYRIGISNDYFYGDAFESAVQKGQLSVQGVSQDKENFRKLLANRIDAFVMDRTVGMVFLHQLPPDQAARIAIGVKPLLKQPLHLLLKRQDPANAELMRRFNRGLHHLRTTGEFERLMLDEAPMQ